MKHIEDAQFVSDQGPNEVERIFDMEQRGSVGMIDLCQIFAKRAAIIAL